MSSFSDIYGYETIKEHMQSAIKLGKVSHAYIINGGLGSGKKMLAGILLRLCSVKIWKRQLIHVINVIPAYRQIQAASLILYGLSMRNQQVLVLMM